MGQIQPIFLVSAYHIKQGTNGQNFGHDCFLRESDEWPQIFSLFLIVSENSHCNANDMARSICQKFMIGDTLDICVMRGDLSAVHRRLHKNPPNPMLQWLVTACKNTLNKKPTANEPLEAYEVLLIGESQKFRVSFPAISFTSQLLATYVKNAMKNRECRISEPDLAIEMLVYFMHACIIDQPFCCKYHNDNAVLWSLARIASMYCIKELAEFIEFLLAELLVGNNRGRSDSHLHPDVDLLLNDYQLAHLFQYTKLAELMLPCVSHCIAKDIQKLQTDSTVYKNLLKNGLCTSLYVQYSIPSRTSMQISSLYLFIRWLPLIKYAHVSIHYTRYVC